MLVNTILRDYMSFLSFGFTPTAVGDSDTHQRWSVPSGIPRNAGARARRLDGGDRGRHRRRRRRDDERAVAARRGGHQRADDRARRRARPGAGRHRQHGGAAVGGDAARRPRRGAGGGVGAVRHHRALRQRQLHDPAARGAAAGAAAASACFTARATPSQRCTMAVGGARPLVVKREPVGARARRGCTRSSTPASSSPTWRRTRARAPRQGLLAAGAGDRPAGLWPVIPQAVDASVVPVATWSRGPRSPARACRRWPSPTPSSSTWTGAAGGRRLRLDTRLSLG